MKTRSWISGLSGACALVLTLACTRVGAPESAESNAPSTPIAFQIQAVDGAWAPHRAEKGADTWVRFHATVGQTIHISWTDAVAFHDGEAEPGCELEATILAEDRQMIVKEDQTNAVGFNPITFTAERDGDFFVKFRELGRGPSAFAARMVAEPAPLEEGMLMATAEPDPGAPPSGMKVYRTGSTGWVTRATSWGLMLQGGGTDCDDAQRWMITKSGGGDYVVLRTDDSNGYNSYLYSTLGGLNSVTTLVVNSTTHANSTYVDTVLRNAEAVFLAGGDQTKYYNNWKGTKVQSALQYLNDTKKVPIGGTSAGMMILSKIRYIPTGTAATSAEALANPYCANMNGLKNDFVNLTYMNNVVSDTHFYERDRMGRYLTFLARGIKDFGIGYASMRGIACDEATALCVDSSGTGTVKGTGYCYVTVGYGGAPETCLSGSKLDWYRGKQAVKVWDLTAGKTFNLSSWTTSSVTPYYVYVDRGTLSPNPY